MCADTPTIRVIGDKVKMWASKDYKDLQSISGMHYLFTINYHEYDCKKEHIQMLASSALEKKYGCWCGGCYNQHPLLARTSARINTRYGCCK